MKKTIQRHRLTEEERHEAARLRAAWQAFKEANPGASQEWLGKTTGIGGQSAVSQYLRGDLALNFANLMKFCGVLQVAPSDISPRLVEEHVTDPLLDDDLFARVTRASGRLEKQRREAPKRGHSRPLSSEAAELIQCVARLDEASHESRKAFTLVTGLLLLAAEPNQSQDTRSAEELVDAAERMATEILADTKFEGRNDPQRKRS